MLPSCCASSQVLRLLCESHGPSLCDLRHGRRNRTNLCRSSSAVLPPVRPARPMERRRQVQLQRQKDSHPPHLQQSPWMLGLLSALWTPSVHVPTLPAWARLSKPPLTPLRIPLRAPPTADPLPPANVVHLGAMADLKPFFSWASVHQSRRRESMGTCQYAFEHPANPLKPSHLIWKTLLLSHFHCSF